MSPTWWRRARLVGGLAVLAVVAARVGGAPFLDGLRTLDGWTLVAALAIAVPTTTCCAWRWSLVARGLGVALPLRAAVAACYQSQLLNTVLPGGVLGDLHRAVRHGRDVGDTARGVRAVVWERLAGQATQVAVAAVVLVLLPSPLHPSVTGTACAAALLVAVLSVAVPAGRRPSRPRDSLWARSVRVAARDLREGLLTRRTWPGVVVASVLAVAGHVATFLVAARTAGVVEPATRMVPLALLVLLAMAVPLNVAGWGVREGAAAWAFGAAGLGVAQGVSTAVVYGVMVLFAALPGAVVLGVAWLRGSVPGPHEGAAHG